MRKIIEGLRSLARAIRDDVARENCRIRHKSQWTRPARGKRECPICNRKWTKGGYRKSYIRNCAP